MSVWLREQLLDVYLEIHIGHTMKLLLGGYIISGLDWRLVRFLFGLINHDNRDVKHKTKFKLSCMHAILAENYKYILYRYKFSLLDFYLDIGNIPINILLTMMDDSVTKTVRELCELRDHVTLSVALTHCVNFSVSQ